MARHGTARRGADVPDDVKVIRRMVGEPKTRKGVSDSMKTINMKIEGTSPLLINRFLEKGFGDKVKKRSAETKSIDPKDKLYVLGDGTPYIPSRYLEACLIDAAKQFKIAGKNKATYSKYVGATVRIEPEAIAINPAKWEPFTIAAVNPMTAGRMMVTRPRFNKWGAEFQIICEDDDVAVDTIEQIMAQGGKFTGIGDWRPAKKGKFGKFRIVEFKEAD